MPISPPSRTLEPRRVIAKVEWHLGELSAVGFTVTNLSCPAERVVAFAGPKSIDTGKISVPGLGGQTGPWKIVSVCHGGPGATRHVITENDLVFE